MTTLVEPATQTAIVYPDNGELSGWIRADNELAGIDTMDGWVSSRLGARFAMELGDLALYHPDGRRFSTYVELMREREQARLRALGVEPDADV